MRLYQFFRAIFLKFPAQTILIICLSLFVAGIEMLGLASALPFLGMLMNDGTLKNAGYVGEAFDFFGIEEFGVSQMLILLCALFVGREVAQNLSETAIQWARAIVETRYRQEYTDLMLGIGYGQLHKHNTGTMINIITTQIDTIGVGVRLLGNLMSNGIVGCIFIFSTLLIEPALVMLLAPVGCLSVVVAIYSSRLSRKYAKANISIREHIITSVNEVLKHFKFIKSGALEGVYGKQLNDGILGYLSNVRRNLVVQFISLSGPQVVTLILVFASLGYYLMLPDTEVQNVLLVVMLLYRASGRIITVQTTWRSLAQHIPAYENVSKSCKRLAADKENFVNGIAVPENLEALKFDNLEYSYDGNNKALHGVKATLPVSGILGVVGPSGAGKTTFVDILTGLVRPSQGTFEMGNTSLLKANITQWRKNIAYIPQDSLLMRGTIRDNLILGAEVEVSEDDFKKACDDCVVTEFVSSLPNGYDTIVRDLGTSVSGGQRQRLLIARALLSNKPIIVLDEGMSALDVKTEKQLFLALQERAEHRLIILVAHRLEPLRYANRIIVFNQGKIVEDGKFDELLHQNGLFTDMVNQWKSGV